MRGRVNPTCKTTRQTQKRPAMVLQCGASLCGSADQAALAKVSTAAVTRAVIGAMACSLSFSDASVSLP